MSAAPAAGGGPFVTCVVCVYNLFYHINLVSAMFFTGPADLFSLR